MRSALLATLVAVWTLAVVPDAAAQSGPNVQEWSTSLHGGPVYQRLDGDFVLGDPTFNSSLEVDGLLDLEDSESFTGVLELRPGLGQQMRLGYEPFRFTGDSVLSTSVTVDGNAYGIGDRVSTDVEFDTYEVAYSYTAPMGPWLRVGPVVQVTLVDALLDTIDLDLPGSAVQEKFLVPIPMAGLRAELRPLPQVLLFTEGKGFTMNSWGELADSTVLQGDVGLQVQLASNVGFTGRYRYVDYDLEAGSQTVDLQLEGLFVGFTVGF